MATITGERSGLQEASDLGNYLELKCCAMPHLETNHGLALAILLVRRCFRFTNISFLIRYRLTVIVGTDLALFGVDVDQRRITDESKRIAVSRDIVRYSAASRILC